MQYHKKCIANSKEILDWLNNAQVVELDIETPNFPSDLKIRFSRWRGDDHSSRMSLKKVSHSKYCCKSCGVILKNIPFYDLPEGNSTKICVACLYLRLDGIKAAFEGMPEEFRTRLTNELILGSM
jgi:hypothetical protein